MTSQAMAAVQIVIRRFFKSYRELTLTTGAK